MKLIAALLLFASCFLGCRDRESPGRPLGNASRITTTPSDWVTITPTPALEVRVETLERFHKYARGNIQSLSRRIGELEALNSTSVTLDASQPGSVYQQIVTSSGRFLVMLTNAEPYLDGFRVTIEIGNITSATYNGFKLNASWPGPVPEDPDANNLEAWSKKSETQKREFSFTDDLPPGAWTRVRLSLTPAIAEDVKAIEISMETHRLGLRKPH
jgi:hypothetical protein